MARKEKKYHFIYKTTNVLSGKYYIGMHSTDNLEDGYLGSGTRLRYSINKHGKENFIREILEYCESREELKNREIEVVNLDEIVKIECMNLKVGGYGGFSSEEHMLNFIENGKKTRIQLLILNNEIIKENHRKSSSERMINNHKNGNIKYGYSFKNKKHSDESKLLISESAKKRVGELSSQLGSFWITDGVNNKKLKKNTVIPERWYKGRV